MSITDESYGESSVGEDPYPEQLDRLEQLVADAYRKESIKSEKRGERPCFSLSVRDLDLRHTSSRLETTMIEIIDAWRTFVETLRKADVFREYILNLDDAFCQLDEIDPSDYRRIKILVDLLTHAINNQHRDNSIECRFVTLLEIILSYGPDWAPSDEVTRFWLRLLQKIDDGISPIEFRRKAYRVLVSLAWVPSSSGLLDACAWDEQKQTIDFRRQAPCESVRRVVAKVRGGEPRPRFDSVNQLLDRLKDETDVCVAIASEKEGMGKTTLAAQVASHHSIRRVFTVLWLNVEDDDGSLSYEHYTKYLDELCNQLSVPKQEWPEMAYRHEEPAFRRIREEALMAKVKERMAKILGEKNVNFLLILDDVDDAALVQRFRFIERQSVIVTTTISDLEGVDWTVELEKMSEGEAIELLLMEANLSQDHILGSTIEARAIVQMCEYNPLVIRTVARWLNLKKATAGLVDAVEEVVHDMETLMNREEKNQNDEEDDPNMLLFDLMSLMMGPTRIDLDSTSVLFILCLSALVVVFPARVPLDAVLLLWEQVLKIEPHAVSELCRDGGGSDTKKIAWLIGEGLLHMGVVQIIDDAGNAWVEVHHRLYKEFALLMAREMDLKGSFDETVVEWNSGFVTEYFAQRIQISIGKVDDNSWTYALECLIHHMITGKMFSTAETVLSEDRFLKARIEAMGWKRALKLQLVDCVALQRAVNIDGAEPLPIFARITDLFKDMAESVLGESVESIGNEVAQFLTDTGLALVGLGFFEKALEFFEDAESKLESDILLASILFGEGFTLLLTHETDQALLRCQACHDLMGSLDEVHEFYNDMLQLVALTLVAQYQYKEALEYFDLIYKKMSEGETTSKVDLGCTLHSKARLLHVMGHIDIAKQVFQECLALKAESGEKSKNMAMAHVSLGDILLEELAGTEAKINYEAALSMMNEIGVNEDDIDYRVTKGKLLFVRGDYSGSDVEFDRCRQMIAEKPDLLLDKSACDLRCIARTYQVRGDSDKAIETLRESLQLTTDRISLERSSALLELGDCLLNKGETNEGLSVLESALEIQIVKLGESTPVLDSLKLIGSVHLAMDALDEALTVYKKVLEVTERISPEEVERLAAINYAIGDVLAIRNDFEESTEYFLKSMEILQCGQTIEHPDVAKALHRLGTIAYAQDDLEKAEQHFSKAYAIRKMHFDKMQLAETAHSLALLARTRGDMETAQELFLDALDIRRSHDNVKSTAETLFEIGNLYRLQRDHESAASIYEKGLEILDDNDELAKDIQFAAGHVKVAQGDYPEALILFKRVRDFRMPIYGRDHIKTGNTSRSLGLAHFLLNNIEESIVHLNEFVRVYEQQDDDADETIDYVLAILLLGDIQNSKGNSDQANNLWSVAKEVCEDNDFVERYPDFVALVNRRLEHGGDSKDHNGSQNGGFFSVLKGLTGDKIQLMSNREERIVIEQLVFLDN